MNLKIGSRGEDVLAWQKFVGATPDGCFGADTHRATVSFQAENNLRCDGRVGANTLAVAVQKGFVPPVNPHAVETCLPESGVGFRGYSRERHGADQFGTRGTIQTIIEIGEPWNELNPDCPIQIGDISRRGGGRFPGHASHRKGTDFDVRPIRRDSKMLPVTIDDPAYDSARTETLVRLVRKIRPGAAILFNDPRLVALGLTKRAKGHHNHLHVRLK